MSAHRGIENEQENALQASPFAHAQLLCKLPAHRGHLVGIALSLDVVRESSQDSQQNPRDTQRG